MGTIKDRTGMDLTEAKGVKKRWQEYTEELYKNDLQDTDNHYSVITHIETDILECEVKWVLGSITMNKASGSDGIQGIEYKSLFLYITHSWILIIFLDISEIKESFVIGLFQLAK